MSGPGVTFSSNPAARNNQRSCMPSIRVTSQLASASSVSALTRRYDRNRSFFEGARFPATQRLCSLEVERELELSRLRDWQIGWPLALKKAGGVDAGLAIGIAAGRGTS